MSAFTEYNARQAIGAIIYLEGLIAALDVRVTALEGAPLIAREPQVKEEKKDAKGPTDSDRVRHRS